MPRRGSCGAYSLSSALASWSPSQAQQPSLLAWNGHAGPSGSPPLASGHGICTSDALTTWAGWGGGGVGAPPRGARAQGGDILSLCPGLTSRTDTEPSVSPTSWETRHPHPVPRRLQLSPFLPIPSLTFSPPTATKEVCVLIT